MGLGVLTSDIGHVFYTQNISFFPQRLNTRRHGRIIEAHEEKFQLLATPTGTVDDEWQETFNIKIFFYGTNTTLTISHAGMGEFCLLSVMLFILTFQKVSIHIILLQPDGAFNDITRHRHPRGSSHTFMDPGQHAVNFAFEGKCPCINNAYMEVSASNKQLNGIRLLLCSKTWWNSGRFWVLYKSKLWDFFQ